MSLLPGAGWLVMVVYGIAMLLLVQWRTKPTRRLELYHMANRDVGVWPGALSIAVTWIWAPAVFFCSLKSYLEGIPGIFWFTAPNVLCFVPFAFVALRLRRLFPQCYSMPHALGLRFPNDSGPHIASLVTVLIIDIVAVIFNTLVGASLLSLVAGIPLIGGVAFMVGIPLAYTVWRGLPASIETDVIQMYVILAFCAVFVPWAVTAGGGLEALSQGIGGVTGLHDSLWDARIAFSWGIPASLALLAVPFSDQMFYQRAFATKADRILPTFLIGGLLFGVVPVTLSLLGFLGASPGMQERFASIGKQIDPLMVNVEVVAALLPAWAIMAFAVMAMCALSSTLDSAYCAISSIVSVDIYRRYVNPGASEERSVYVGELAMIAIAVGAAVLVLTVPLKGEWLFNINGSVACCVVPPLLLATYWRQTLPRAVTWGVVTPLVTLCPIAIYANVVGNALWIVCTMVGVLLLSTCITVLGSAAKQKVRESVIPMDEPF